MQPYFIAAIVAFTPTLILMYMVLKRYTFPAVKQPFFSDPTLFGLFAVGLGTGSILFLLYSYLSWGNLIYAILFAVIQCLVVVVILNLKRFHGKSDTVFYGFGLGLGMGCVMSLGTFFFLSGLIIGTESGDLDITQMLLMFLLGLAHILMMSSIGTIIGEGIARLRPMEYALQGIILNVIFYIILVGAFSSSGSSFYVFVILALAFSAAYFYRTMYSKLSGVVKDVLRMEGKKRDDVPR